MLYCSLPQIGVLNHHISSLVTTLGLEGFCKIYPLWKGKFVPLPHGFFCRPRPPFACHSLFMIFLRKNSGRLFIKFMALAVDVIVWIFHPSVNFIMEVDPRNWFRWKIVLMFDSRMGHLCEQLFDKNSVPVCLYPSWWIMDMKVDSTNHLLHPRNFTRLLSFKILNIWNLNLRRGLLDRELEEWENLIGILEGIRPNGEEDRMKRIPDFYWQMSNFLTPSKYTLS